MTYTNRSNHSVIASLWYTKSEGGLVIESWSATLNLYLVKTNTKKYSDIYAAADELVLVRISSGGIIYRLGISISLKLYQAYINTEPEQS